jgi:hypothetical protein
MKKLFWKFLAFFLKEDIKLPYDVPPDHTWSKQSVAAQKVVQEEALDALVENSKDFIETKGYVVAGRPTEARS